MPREHETVLASAAHIGAGGKGLCQAIAARRLGAEVKVLGAVGEDMFGDYLLASMASEGIDIAGVTSRSAGTHLGIPILTDDGNNRIIGVPRASLYLTPADVESNGDALSWADVLLVQNETPLETITAAIQSARQATLVVWNPAPARFSVTEVASSFGGRSGGWLTPNETEAGALTGIEVGDVDSGLAAAHRLQADVGAVGVVVTLGSQGAVAVDLDGQPHVAAPYTVRAVDPTAAGDTFTAALALRLKAGASVPAALSFACAAGAATATHFGAVTSIPTSTLVQALIDEAGCE